jgi:hypothetical protein
MTFLRDPGLDQAPDRWASPEYDPGFPEVHDIVRPEDDENPGGPVRFVDGDEMHRETIEAIAASNAALARIVRILSSAGMEIVTLTAGALPASQRIRFRVQYLVISRATAGDAILGIGSGSFTFTVAAVPVRVDFPLVIERGVDMTMTGDGRLYLVGWPE